MQCASQDLNGFRHLNVLPLSNIQRSYSGNIRVMRIIASIAVILLILTASPPAYAYLDPGSISMFIQALVAAVVGGLVVFRLYWYKFKTFLVRKKKLNKG